MIALENVGKKFRLSGKQKRELGARGAENAIWAVSGVSFTCRPGRIFSLLGPNGAGKTTALRMIATMLRPTGGDIKVCGYDTVDNSREVRKRIGFLTGNTGLYARLTPEELVRYYARLNRRDHGTYEKRKTQLFDLLDIHGFAGQRIGKLSSGMKQKVSIARTMIHDPEVVIFDEPTVGLDVITSRSIIQLIRSCREQGKTVIFSTHIMGEVSLLSDDLAIIHRGRLLFNDSFQTFKKRLSASSVEDEFIRIIEGSPEKSGAHKSEA
jgi:sodium transport system ATP-binding protein